MDALRASLKAKPRNRPRRPRRTPNQQEEGDAVRNVAGAAALAHPGNIAFTGRLGSMKRAEAFALVRQHGGTPRRGVTKGTDHLVVGQLGLAAAHRRAAVHSSRARRTYGVTIVSERRFLEWIGRGAADEEQRSYSAEQIRVGE